MKGNLATALGAALLLHAGLLAFGGLLLFREPEAKKAVEEVDIVTPESEKKEDKDEKAEEARKDEAQSDADAELTARAEPVPTAPESAGPAAPAGPALDALSLADLEGVLNPDAAGGSFAESFSLASGGRIGASGAALADEAIGEALSSADLDQRPRPVLTVEPVYPAELRKRRLEGTVSVVFLVGTDGKVRNPQVERSTDPSFDRPALEAVRQWKFEPGMRNGAKVEFKMRQPIRFRAS